MQNLFLSFRPLFSPVLLIVNLFGALALASCQEEVSPSISDKFTGALTIKKETGVTQSSGQEVIVQEISNASLQISGATFETFTITGFTRTGNTWVSSQGENSFNYSGEEKNRSLLFDWTVTLPNGQTQTVLFGGSKKKK